MNRQNQIAFILFIAAIVLYPVCMSGSYTITVGIFAGMHALVAIGLAILMGYAGQVSLGQAAFFGIGAYVSSILSVNCNWPVAYSMFAAIIVASFTSVLLAIPALRLKGHYLAVATLGFGEIVNIILNEWGPGGPSGFGDIPHLSILGFTFDSPSSFFLLVWTLVALTLLFSYNFINSRVGRALKAMHDSEQACGAMGLSVALLKVQVFVIAAAYAALAGGLYAHYMTFLSPSSFTLSHSILFLMMVVVGGVRSLWGAIVGAVLITILPELLKNFSDYDMLAYGVILTITLIFFRKGLVPILAEGIAKLRGALSARNS
jgi:branched-chain amino acid transport system permease protein